MTAKFGRSAEEYSLAAHSRASHDTDLVIETHDFVKRLGDRSAISGLA